MKNKIISIGYVSNTRCYLNISEEEAIERYCKSENINIEDIDEDMIETIEFDDEFGAYTIYNID